MKPIRTLLVLVFACVTVVAPAHAVEPQDIDWEDLALLVEPFDDPFAELSEDDLLDLATVYYYEDSQSAEEVEAAVEARQRLEDAGIDIAYYMEQRDIVMSKRMEEATRINPDILGKQIRLPGYLLPLEMKDRLVVEFLLVPYVGACIHTPPPDANQIIHVVYPEGILVDGLFDPVWITGELIADPAKKTVGFSDGTSDVEVSYKMNASDVEKYVY